MIEVLGGGIMARRGLRGDILTIGLNFGAVVVVVVMGERERVCVWPAEMECDYAE